jgi:hypothetical protein
MPPITSTIDVDRPADDVFAYATDLSRFSEWQTRRDRRSNGQPRQSEGGGAT